MCLTRAPSHPCHYSRLVVMTINHSIPHQQLLPNVTLLLIKIHPAARHWGTNDLEIGFPAPECASPHTWFPPPPGRGEEELRSGGQKKLPCIECLLCARYLRDMDQPWSQPTSWKGKLRPVLKGSQVTCQKGSMGRFLGFVLRQGLTT